MKLKLKTIERRFNALGMHIYAGGFTVGVRRHFTVKTHLEEWLFGTETVKANFPDIDVRIGPDKWNWKQFTGKIDWLFCNPPCAAWSLAGSKKGKVDRWKTDDRVDCTRRCFEALEVIQPTFFAWESVTQAWGQGRDFIMEKAAGVMKLGYNVTIILLDGHGCGLAQHRKRFFFVAHKMDFKPECPDQWGTTVKDVLTNVPEADDNKRDASHHRGAMARILTEHPELNGQKLYLREIYDKYRREDDRGRPPFICNRCTWNAPSGTIMADNVWHPERPSALSKNEMKRMCSYPDDYKFVELKKNEVFKQMTQAVMPLVGEWLAKQVKAALEQGVAVHPTERQCYLYDFRKQGHPKISDLGGSIPAAHRKALGKDAVEGSFNEGGSGDLPPAKRRLVLRVQRLPEGNPRRRFVLGKLF